MTYCDPTTDIDFDVLLQRFNFWIHHAPDHILRQSITELEYKPNPEKWSKKEICGHLVDSAINNLQRFTGAVHAKDNFNIYPYPQAALVQINNYQQQPAPEIIQLWQQLNRQIYHVVSDLNESQLAQPIVMTKTNAVYDLKWLISDYICHLEHHLKQLFPLEQTVYTPEKDWLISVMDASNKLEGVSDPFLTLFKEKNMSVELYVPEGKDLQSPHLQDELYVVISGQGTFSRDGERIPFSTGDVIFVPAHMDHRFEDFSTDFKTWVVFY